VHVGSAKPHTGCQARALASQRGGEAAHVCLGLVGWLTVASFGCMSTVSLWNSGESGAAADDDYVAAATMVTTMLMMEPVVPAVHTVTRIDPSIGQLRRHAQAVPRGSQR
jgi:hypothetical protein